MCAKLPTRAKLTLKNNQIQDFPGDTAIQNQDFGKSKIRVRVRARAREKPKIKTKTKTETKAGEPARGARSAPRVGVLTCFVSVFVFVLTFGFSNFDFRYIFIR